MELFNNMSSLYIGDLEHSVEEAYLFDIFRSFGSVISVKICKDPVTKTSLGYGYVNFRLQEDAEKAIKGANFSTINGKQCRIMWSNRNDLRRKKSIGNIFIKNIPYDLDSKSLFEAFSSFGPIMSCKVCVDEYGLSRGFGFIQYYEEAHAKDALAKANGVVFKNKKLVVAPFLSKIERPNAQKIDPSKYTNIFVKNIKDVWNLDDLRDKFSKFGEITSCVLQKDKEGNSLGFGFVNFSNTESAEQAKNEMDGLPLSNGLKLYVSKFMKKNERKAFLKKEHERRRQELAKKFKDQNLYVKNFDESFTDEKLLQEFSVFGTVQSHQIMKDDKGKSKGFGFVCFSSAEHAKSAMEALNGKIIDNKALFVAIAQPKEDRRRMLEERRSNDPMKNQQYPYPVPFIYTQPMYPYPPMQHPGYPQNPPMVKGMTRGITGTNGYGSNQRMIYGGYNQHMNVYPSHHGNPHRTRGASNQMRGGHYQGSPLNQRQGQITSGNRPINSQGSQVAAVNQVVVESQPKQRREDRSARSGPEMDAFCDRIYGMCQSVSEEKQYKFDEKSLGILTGRVLDYLSRNHVITEDEEIKKVIVECCKEYVSKSVPQK